MNTTNIIKYYQILSNLTKYYQILPNRRKREHAENMDPVEEYLRSNSITIRGTDFPRPAMELPEIDWPTRIAQSLKRQNFTKPTCIQATSWPVALAGRDLVGIAQTGSGKTLAYILPGFMHIDKLHYNRKGRYEGPTVLVLAPTRELAQQIQTVCQEFDYHRSVCIFGGAPKGPQIRDADTPSRQSLSQLRDV